MMWFAMDDLPDSVACNAGEHIDYYLEEKYLRKLLISPAKTRRKDTFDHW